jgi:ADP-heptose:LPS heptosyltransferase
LRILVIRRDNIGDLVCTTPLLAALRRRYPHGHIAALVNSYNAAVLDGNPDVDAVHVYTKLKHRLPGQSALGIVAARLRMLRELRREPFDYIILASAIFNTHGLRFARQLRRANVVGFSNGDEPGAKHITIRVPIKDYSHLHEVEVLALLASAIDVHDAEGPLRVFPKERCVQAWQARMPELQSPGRPWVAVHISARERERQWPVERWGDFIGQLTATGVGVVLIWAPGPEGDPRHPGDDEKASHVLAATKDNPLVRAAPTTTLDDLIAVLRLCHAFVGADGGAMHIAAALGLPMAVLFEGVVLKKYRWYPWHVPHELVASETRDITAISVAQLTEAWQRLTSRVALAASTRAAIPLAARAHE